MPKSILKQLAKIPVFLTATELARRVDTDYRRIHRLMRAGAICPDGLLNCAALFLQSRVNEIAVVVATGEIRHSTFAAPLDSRSGGNGRGKVDPSAASS